MGVVLAQGEAETEPISKFPSLSSETVMFACAAEISPLRELASADRLDVTRHSGICRGGDKLFGMDGYAMTIEEGDLGSVLWFARRGRNC